MRLERKAVFYLLRRSQGSRATLRGVNLEEKSLRPLEQEIDKNQTCGLDTSLRWQCDGWRAQRERDWKLDKQEVVSKIQERDNEELKQAVGTENKERLREMWMIESTTLD